MDVLSGGVVFVAAVAVLFVAVRAVTRLLFGRRLRLEEHFADDVLRRRLASGQISQSEYEAAEHAIGRK